MAVAATAALSLAKPSFVKATIGKFDEDGDRGGQPTTGAEKLRHYVDNQLEEMIRFRDHIGLIGRLNNCLRAREGVYDPLQQQAIAQFGGSAVFARLTTNKIRGGAALLRSFFVQGERPWEIKPTPVPTLPTDIAADIEQVVTMEAQTLAQAGEQIDERMIQRRIDQLTKAAATQARKEARDAAEDATRYIDDILVEGSFYHALNDFILDFSSLPLAIMRGPIALMQTGVSYVNGKPERTRKAVLSFRRVDPYDFVWSPGATSMEDADVIERQRMSRTDLNALLGLEGFDEDAIRSALRDYGEAGHRYHQFDQQVRDDVQSQSSVFYNTSLDTLAFSGRLIGREIKEYEIKPADAEMVIDDDLDYNVQAWVCGRYVLKAQIDPDPRCRIPYYVAAYEPVPGSIPGTSLPELIADIQETYNATLRALVNNVAISSGPQVGVNTDRWEPPADGEVRLAPWMIWRYNNDPTTVAGEKPIEFFQPSLNAESLMALLGFLQNLADEISGIPRYLTGSGVSGGAGRTSSGLSMLMSNATRTMTSVAGGIDQNVLAPLLTKVYDLVLLTTGNEVLRGDESINPKGATAAETRDTDRMRMIEFGQMTQNPVDVQIMGLKGRSNLLRHIAEGFAAGQEIVPSEQDMEAQQRAMEQQQAQAAAAGEVPPEEGGEAAGGPPGGQQQAAPQPQKSAPNKQAEETDNIMRTRSPATVRRSTR